MVHFSHAMHTNVQTFVINIQNKILLIKVASGVATNNNIKVCIDAFEETC